MRPSTSGPGRQVQDASYYLGLLRSKCTMLTTEITRLNGEIEQSHKDTNTYATLERQYETLIKTVRGLEGELADYNLAMDKSRTSTDPADITQYHAALKRRNEYEAGEIDKIFMQRQDRERAIADIEEQMRVIQSRAAAKLDSLPEAARDEYRRLLEENERFSGEITQMQAQLESYNLRISHAEEELGRDRWREEGQRLEKQIGRLRAQLSELQEEARDAEMDPAEMRERLFSKVKSDNEKLATLARRLEEIEEDNEGKRRTIADLDADLDDRKGEDGESQKYEVLYRRDQEITEFLERFPEEKGKADEEKKRMQETIVALLEHSSKELERQHHLPTAEQAANMATDAEAKATEVENAESTHKRLQAELQKRQQELEKIQTLDQKITVELKSLSEKMETMRTEMVTFANIDELKRSSEETTKILEEKRELYVRRRDMARQQVKLLAARVERAKKQLDDDETSKGLEALEQKLRHYENSIFAMREFIDTKGRESEYVSLRDEATKMCDDLNATIMKVQASIVPTMTAAPY